MTTLQKKYAAGFGLILFTFATTPLSAQQPGWRGFRGNEATGVSEQKGLPVEISDTDNLAWKVELPGRGPSGPIVVGDRIFVTCSGGAGEDQLYVVCFDVNQGHKLWQRKFRATGRCFCHPLSANAAPTPCTDGESVFAFFSSNDLVCLDLDGNLKWFRGLAVDHPKAGHDTGMSSSPAVYGDTIVCQVENQGDSFVTAIDKNTGATIWEIERARDASWSSPIIFADANQRALCLLNSADRATIVELVTGKTVWEKMGRSNPIPSPSIAGNEIYLPLDGTTAIQLNDDGSFSERWTSSRATAGSASNVVYNESFYSLARGGVLNCFNVADGERTWQSRVGGQFWSTPIIADDRMYLFAQDGKVSVVALSGSFANDDERVLYTHTFTDEVFLASPAVSHGAIFIRSDKYLYKFAKDPA